MDARNESDDNVLIRIVMLLYYFVPWCLPSQFRRRLRNPKRMRFSVQHKVIETDNIRVREDEEEIFEGFGHPETLLHASASCPQNVTIQ
jgi:hypothetical protein